MATLSPGVSIESLDVGSLYLGPTFNLDFEFDTITGVDTSDLINVTATNGLTITGAGTLNITNAGTMTGGVYKLIDYNGTLNGSLSNITLGTTPAGFTYSLVNNTPNTSIDLIVTMAGDFNGDGIVDAGDYVVWRKGFGTIYTQADFDTWRAHFGEAAPTAASSAAVPEPATWLLLSAIGAMLLFRFGVISSGARNYAPCRLARKRVRLDCLMTARRSNARKLLISVLSLLANTYCPAAVASFTSGFQTGNIQNTSITEASGIAASRMNPMCCGPTTTRATLPKSLR